MIELQVTNSALLGYVYWRWSLHGEPAGYSRLHRKHPRAEGFTSCGCSYKPSPGNGVHMAYENIRPHRTLGVEACEECVAGRVVQIKTSTAA